MRPTYVDAQRLHGTLRQRRQTLTAKTSKRRDDHSDLILRLKVIFELRTPESWRESLAANLPSLTARCKPWEAPHWMPFRAVNWIISTFWARLPIEQNPKVRVSLLRLGARMLTRPPFTYSLRMSDDVARCATLDVLEQEDLSTEERERALGFLEDILMWNESAEECGVRIGCMCLRIIAHHCATGEHTDKEMRRLASCLRIGVMERFPSPLVSVILDDDHALPYIFEGICSAEGRLHQSLSSLLSGILEASSPADRVTLVTRHFPQLRQAFHLMCPRDLVYFMIYPEFAGIVATTPSLLRLIHARARHDCAAHEDDCWSKFAYDDYCEIVTFVLESALSDDSRLQEILGYGFMSVAGHFAANRFDANARRAHTFRRILAAHPEWHRRFKEMTCNGVEGNLTADLGRAIVEKKRLHGNYYILEEEDSVL